MKHHVRAYRRIKIVSMSHRLRPAAVLQIVLAVSLSLAGCAGSGGDQNTEQGGESPAPATTAAATAAGGGNGGAASTPAATQTPGPAVAPVPAAVLDPAALQPVFGFAGVAGKQILVSRENNDWEEQMQALDIAIGSGGQVLKVRFESWQPGNEQSNGRELAGNLPNLSGYVFKVVGGAAKPDETYYLADSSAFNQAALVTVEPAPAEAEQLSEADPVRSSIAEAKQRQIMSAWKLASLPPGRELYLVQFVRQNQDMLFSLVLEEEGKLSFMDYPAEITGNEYSVWRVDDGGEVIPQMFSLLYAARTADGLLLGINWLGAEGINSFFLAQSGESFKELDIQYSRYTSPM
ncbi:hypothetical protein [Paenibacillus sp. DMB5]|uniref:hypothetical protein n=1 Tax=Paenibacillus sp. DMB5 TaxID=1780103 RepID=UPI00076BFEE8|nr:hypothetical protein [Paenibacillus sp. DMB5]KUP24587.1 hypothetical protein AWJ19_19855 [Paenibacillus sp. DMB5]